MTSKIIKWAGAAALTALTGQAFADEECRAPMQMPDMDVQELADMLSHTAPSEWPEIGQYADEYLIDVGRWLKSARGLDALGDAAEETIALEIVEKLKSGETVQWDAVLEDVGFGAREVVTALQNDAALTPEKAEDAIRPARKGINEFGKEASAEVFRIVDHVKPCKDLPGGGAPEMHV